MGKPHVQGLHPALRRSPADAHLGVGIESLSSAEPRGVLAHATTGIFRALSIYFAGMRNGQTDGPLCPQWIYRGSALSANQHPLRNERCRRRTDFCHQMSPIMGQRPSDFGGTQGSPWTSLDSHLQ